MAPFLWATWGRTLLPLLALAILALGLGLARAAPTPQDVDREIRAGRYDQALVMLADVRKERPLSATAEWLTASALFGKGDVQEAGAHLAAARRLDPALSGAAPARVAQIEGALRGQERMSFWRLLAGVLVVGALGALAVLLLVRVRRARQRRAARAEALDSLYRRVKAREDEIEAEKLGVQIAALTDPTVQDRLRQLEDESNLLYGALTEVQDGPVEAMAAYSGPRPRKARSAEPATGAATPARRASAAVSSPRPGPVTVVQGSSSGDLLTGVLLGQALTPTPSAAPAPARPDPTPEPERRTESVPASWENPSSLSEDRKPSWEAPSSLSSGASYDNSASSSSSSWGGSDSSSSNSSSSDSGSW